MGPEARNQNQGLRVVRLGLEMRQKKQDLAARLAYPIAIAWRRRAVCWQGYHTRSAGKVCWQGYHACSQACWPALGQDQALSRPLAHVPSAVLGSMLFAVLKASDTGFTHAHTHTHRQPLAWSDALCRSSLLFVVPSFCSSPPRYQCQHGADECAGNAWEACLSSFLFASCLPHASHERLCPMSSAPMPSLVRI